MDRRKTHDICKILFRTVICLVLLLLSSCVSVKAYQKAQLNDSDMRLEERLISHYQTTAESYREGAAGGGGDKVGGGCGCN